MDSIKFKAQVESRHYMTYDSEYNRFWEWKIKVEAIDGAHILDSDHLDHTCEQLLSVLPKWRTYRGVKCNYISVLPISMSNIAEAYNEIRNYSLMEIDKVPDEPLRLIWQELGRVKEIGGKLRGNSDYYIISVCKPLMFLWGQTPAFDSMNRREMRNVSLGPVLSLPRGVRWTYRQWKATLQDLKKKLKANSKLVNYCNKKALEVYGTQYIVPYGRYLDIYYYGDDEMGTSKIPKSSLQPASWHKKKGELEMSSKGKITKTVWLPLIKAKPFAVSKGFNVKVNHIESFKQTSKHISIQVGNPNNIRRALYMKMFHYCNCWCEFQSVHWPEGKYKQGAHMKACEKYERIAEKVFLRYPQTKKIIYTCQEQTG